MKTHRHRYRTILLLIIAGLAILAMGALTQRRNFLTRGIPTDFPEPIPHSETKLGINVYLEQYDDEELAHQLQAIYDTNIRYVKQSFYYSDEFDWTEADRLITAVTTQNLTLIPLLDGNPVDHFAPIPPRAIRQMGRRIRHTLR